MPIPTITDLNISPLLCRISLSGSDASNTRNGRLWLRLTDSSGTVTAGLYRHPAMQAGDLVATAAGEGPVLELEEEGESGLSGTIELATSASALIASAGPVDGTVQAHIATDADMAALEPGLSKLLSAEGEYAGEPGFAWALGQGHREVYRILAGRLLAAGLDHHEAAAAPVLLRDPTMLTPAVALFALASQMLRESARGAPEPALRAGALQQRAMRAIALCTVTIVRPSGLPDLPVSMGDLRIRR